MRPVSAQALLLVLVLAACAPRPHDQTRPVEPSDVAAVYEALWPTFEGLLRTAFEWGLGRLRPRAAASGASGPNQTTEVDSDAPDTP